MLPGSEVQAVLDKGQTPSGNLFPSPEDWRDECIYFLMVDRFNNPDAAPRNAPFDAQFNQFQGGTFNGIREKLGYLKDLGIGALWLSPVLKNCQFDVHAYHGYGIQNFLAVEPRFASRPELGEIELRSLVDEAHRLGIYVIFDIVLHHAGDVFEYVIEQRFSGHKDAQHKDDSMVREALWGKLNGFDVSHPLYQALQKILAVRNGQPALRYGRLYFRPISGDGFNFGLSPFPSGVLAFSRILNDQEVVVVANTNTQQGFAGEVIVDRQLNPARLFVSGPV